MGRARWRLLVSMLLGIVFLVALGGAATTYAEDTPPPGSPVTRADVFKALGVDELPADYVLLLDTSGSMRGQLYADVKQALRGFISAMSPSDYLGLMTFDVAPAIRYTGVAGDSERAVAQLPIEATGRATDIGAAIQAALEELERPDAASVNTLVMLTDGSHEPPRGSAYPEASGAAWERLNTRAVGLSGRVLRTYALGIGGQDTDAALLKTVFPDATIVALPTEQIADYLERIKEQTRIAKAQQILGDDLNGTVDIIWPQAGEFELADGRASVEVTVRSGFRHVPVSLENIELSADGFEVEATALPETIALEPGQELTLEVPFSWARADGLQVGQREVERRGQMTLAAAVSSPWGTVIRDELGLQFEPSVQTESWPFAASGVVGLSFLTLGAGLLGLLLALLLLLYLWRASKPRLRGRLRIVEPNSPSAEITLGGRVTKIRATPAAPGIKGTGSVRGKRVKRRGKRGSDVVLVITYARQGGKHLTKECAWGKTAVVDGVTFKHTV